MTFHHYDYIVSEWIEKHGLEEDIDSADFRGGVESIVNPDMSEKNIRNAILQKEGYV